MTTTFLFTDVEGSTRRWEAATATMSVALSRHDALLVAAIEGHGGQVFKTVGDGFYAVFTSPAGALAAAAAAQRDLAAEDWSSFGPDLSSLQVRMAIHTGTAEQRGGDFFGPALNRCARLLATGHGGQVLVSDVAAGLLIDTLPHEVALRSLGRHRLKDLALPMEVFQAVAPGLPSDFPPLASLDRVRHNLPVQTTSFVGRAKELAALRDRLATARLVTLVGAGGTGKTRLALQLGAECLDAFEDGTFFVDLAPLATPALVPAAAVQALGLPNDPGREPRETLSDFLRRWPRVLLILDNCEHVLAAAAELAHGLLTDSPALRILATSREVLAVPGEAVWPLAPLTVPEAGTAPVDPEALSAYDAVRLFVDRAEAARPGFRVTGANASAVAHLCQRLDGIPLALELAAARVRLFSPADLAARLDARFRLLTGGSRVALPRHQTLRACLDWSYDLLPDGERRVLERLGVFAGHIPIEAAEAVCAGGAMDEMGVLDALAALEAKSLVAVDHAGEPSACRLLETIRAYARERLHESGDETATRSRHLAWCHAFARAADLHVDGPDYPAWYQRYTRNREDFNAAVAWGVVNEDACETRRAIETKLALVHYAGFDVSDWSDTIGSARRLGDPMLIAAVSYRAWAMDQLAREIGTEIPEAPGTHVLVRLGRAILAGDDTVPSHYAALGLRREEAWLLQDCGSLLLFEAEDTDAALALGERALAVKLAIPAPDWDIAICMNHLGEVHRWAGRYSEAEALFESGLRRSSLVQGPVGWRSWLHANLSACQTRTGKPTAAIRSAVAAIRDNSTHWDVRATATFLPWCACAHAAAGDGITAARLFGAASEAYRSFGGDLAGRVPMWSLLGKADWDHIAHGDALARSHVSPEGWNTAFVEGKAMSADEAVAYALSVGMRASDVER